jgi:hypothetical protein
MSVSDLGILERSALLALMAEAREVPNPELSRRFGLDLNGAHRRRLNQLDLVSSRRDGRQYVHELTDKGWRWCADELTGTRPPRSFSAGGALYAVLAGLRRYLDRSSLTLADVFGAGAAAPAVASAPAGVDEDRIRAAYRDLAREPRAWVSLADLRARLGAAAREDVDAVLRAMSRARTANLVPQANQKILAAADRAAAVRIGGEDCHLISIGDA